MTEDDNNMYVEMDLDIRDVQLLYKSVCFHHEKWPGGDIEEQQGLTYMKDFLYRIVLEHRFQNM